MSGNQKPGPLGLRHDELVNYSVLAPTMRLRPGPTGIPDARLPQSSRVRWPVGISSCTAETSAGQGGSAKTSQPPKPKPQSTPPQKVAPIVSKKTIICELIDAEVQCEHGRTPALNGTLMVVPDSTASLGDKISGTIQLKGGCGAHPEWVVGGFWSSSGQGSSFNFNAKTWAPSARGLFSLQHVSPHTYQVDLSGCAGSLNYEIRAYPPGKVAFKIDVRAIWDTLREWIKHIPIPDEELNEWTKEWFQGSIQYEGAWKEDEGSWKAYYEKSWSGQFDPLVGGKYKGPIYPMTLVPGWLSSWVKAGLFFEIKFGAKIQAAIKGKYWPDAGKTRWSEKSISGGGGGGGGLSLELKLASSDLVEGSISGDTGVGFEVTGAIDGEEPKVEVAAKFEGVQGVASMKAMWGWVEIQRSVQLVAERERKKEWIFADSAGG